MLLYHGSNVKVEKPVLLGQTRGLDFGSGFYTTSNKEQAIAFTKNVARRTGTGSRVVSIFEFEESTALPSLSVLRFSDPDEKWLDFVYQNRFAVYGGEQYDLIIGPVANDAVFPTLQAYFTGALPKDAVLAALKIKDLFDQYVFATEAALDELAFQEAIEIGEGV